MEEFFNWLAQQPAGHEDEMDASRDRPAIGNWPATTNRRSPRPLRVRLAGRFFPSRQRKPASGTDQPADENVLRHEGDSAEQKTPGDARQARPMPAGENAQHQQAGGGEVEAHACANPVERAELCARNPTHRSETVGGNDGGEDGLNAGCQLGAEPESHTNRTPDRRPDRRQQIPREGKSKHVVIDLGE